MKRMQSFVIKQASSKSAFIFMPFLAVTLFSVAFWPSSNSTPTPVAKIGTKVLAATINTQGYQINVDRYTLTPDTVTQKLRITVKLSIKNTSGTVLQISPGLQMSIIDQNKTAFQATAKFLPFGTVVGGPVNPSTTNALTVDFEIPLKSTPKQFAFQKDGSSQVLKVAL